MFNEQSLEFQQKIMERSGLGDDTYLPEGRLGFASIASQAVLEACIVELIFAASYRVRLGHH